MTIAVTKPRVAAAFPAAKVEACLRSELLEAAAMEAELHGAAWPADAAAKGSASVHIDSLVVVDILCAVEPVLGYELREGVVRAGGYWSVDQAIGHLMPQIEQDWRKRKGGT